MRFVVPKKTSSGTGLKPTKNCRKYNAVAATIRASLRAGQRSRKSLRTSATAKDETARLASELHAIHCENMRYWKRGAEATLAERAEYQRKLGRLDEIRGALAETSRENNAMADPLSRSGVQA